MALEYRSQQLGPLLISTSLVANPERGDRADAVCACADSALYLGEVVATTASWWLRSAAVPSLH